MKVRKQIFTVPRAIKNEGVYNTIARIATGLQVDVHAERRKEIVKVYAIMTMLLFGLLAACATVPTDADVQTPDERAITTLIRGQVAAYNAQNTPALIATFAPASTRADPMSVAPGAGAGPPGLSFLLSSRSIAIASTPAP